ncbi:hypothetical protein [uncultured Roseobacter sp.]|nr:hypothetical protein [uncultured Roseobacter sp.]
MTDTFYLVALGLMIFCVVLIVLRGLRRKPDGSNNKSDIGGGPGSDP